jgi:Ca2+-binding EF-hand superfamily protein
MSVSSISSQSAVMAEWRTYLQQASRQQQTVSSSSTDGDSATISQQGFAALLGTGAAGGAGGPPPPPPGGLPELTDSQVAAISSNIQSQNADLFSALDSDSSGNLSASELKAAQELFRPDSTGSTSSTSQSGQPPALTDEQVASISSKIQSANAKLFSALDTNQDGTVSADELKAGHDQLMPQGGPGGAGGAQGAGGPMGPPPPPPPDDQTNLESQLTDDQAAAIGSSMKSQSATLFASLDTDSSGTLSASELKTGVEQFASTLVNSITGSSNSSSNNSTAQDNLANTSDNQRDTWQSSLQANIVQSVFKELFSASTLH